MKRLLINRLQQHDGGSTKHLILGRGYADRAGFPVVLRHIHPLDRRCHIGTTLGSVQQSGKIAFQVLFVLGDTLPVHSWRAIASHPVEGFSQPFYIQIVVERRQPLLRSLTSYFRYPLLFCAHVF